MNSINSTMNSTSTSIFTLNTTAQAFTKTVKSADGTNVLRTAIPKFDFEINLSLDLNSTKMRQVITNLVVEAIKVSIQNQDRAELWAATEISSKFTSAAALFNEDKLHELVCLNSSGAFGLKSFKLWVKDSLIPAIAIGTGKELTTSQKSTILMVVNEGKRMPEQSMVRVLEWIDKYGSELDDVDKAMGYLTSAVVKDDVDLDALGF